MQNYKFCIAFLGIKDKIILNAITNILNKNIKIQMMLSDR